jgi:uncharacterized protein (TIGR02266 family)
MLGQVMGSEPQEVWGRWMAPARREETKEPVSDHSDSPRDSKRIPLVRRIQLKFDRFSGFISEYVANVSPGGIFIRTTAPEPPGQILEFEFRLGDGFELIKGRGEVVWARGSDQGPDLPAGMGVRFLQLSPGSKELIYKIVDDYIQGGGTPFDLVDLGEPPAPAPPSAPPTPRPAQAAPAAPAQGPAALPPSPGASGPSSPAAAPAPLTPARRPASSPPPPAWPSKVFPAGTPQASAAAPAAPATPVAPAAPAALAATTARQVPEAPAGFGAAGDPPRPMSGARAFAPASAALPPPEDPPRALPPAVPAPTFAVLHAEPRTPPPRRWLWVLLAAVVVVTLAGFLLRDDLLRWTGLEDEAVVVAVRRPPAARPHPSRSATGAATSPVRSTARPGLSPPGATSAAAGRPAGSAPGPADGAAAPASPAAGAIPPVSSAGGPGIPGAAVPMGTGRAGAPSIASTAPARAAAAPGAPASPAPLVHAAPGAPASPAPPVHAVPGAAGSPAGPTSSPLTALEKVTWESSPTGTDVILWGNGAFLPDSYHSFRLAGPLPREVIRVTGVSQPFPVSRVPVGTPQLRQVRIGYHVDAGTKALHIVLDLDNRGVEVTDLQASGRQLRIHLKGN